MDFHAEKPFLALLRLALLRIPLHFWLFGGIGRGNHVDVHNCSLEHRPLLLNVMCLEGHHDFLTELMLLLQKAKGQDGCFIGNPIIFKLDIGTASCVLTSLQIRHLVLLNCLGNTTDAAGVLEPLLPVDMVSDCLSCFF